MKKVLKTYATVTGPARRLGRPSVAETEQLNTHLLDVAERLFLAHGFEGISMDTMAIEARASKRTIYHRYPSKDALFEAVIERAINRLLKEAGNAPKGDSLQERLERLALTLIEPSLNPHLPSLLRTMIASVARFPHLAQSFDGRGRTRIFGFVAKALEKEVAAKTLVLRWPIDRSAEQFLNLTVSGFVLRGLLGVDPDVLRADANGSVAQNVGTFLAANRVT